MTQAVRAKDLSAGQIGQTHRQAPASLAVGVLRSVCRSVASAGLLSLVVLSCAPSFSDSFERSRSAALRAYSSGRYVEAAEHWEQVAKAAPNRKQRYEALYRAGSAYKRGRRHDRAKATFKRILTEAPSSSRAPRAAYDLADIEVDAGDERAGYTALSAVIERYPAASSASSAMNRYLVWLEEDQGPAAARAYLEQLITRKGDTELGQYAHYALARLLRSMGDKRAALQRYLLVAERFPYPQGALWDDSLFHASVLEEELGNPQRAVAHLRRMLKEREPSSLSGSYERPRYSESQHRLAVLYRDALKQPAQAAAAFRSLRLEFSTSILRDDAAWQEAKLLRAQGDNSGACTALKWLREEIPDSRYAACAQLLCAELRPIERECRRYIARELNSGE